MFYLFCSKVTFKISATRSKHAKWECGYNTGSKCISLPRLRFLSRVVVWRDDFLSEWAAYKYSLLASVPIPSSRFQDPCRGRFARLVGPLRAWSTSHLERAVLAVPIHAAREKWASEGS
jgi:hypothetical protein